MSCVALLPVPGEKGVRVEEVVTAHGPRILLHFPHGAHGVESLPLPHRPRHPVHAQVVEHPVVCPFKSNIK
jgi:hypothetical protein